MKPGRCKTTTVNCAYCGKPFEALNVRLKVGWGLYCSRECSNKALTKGKNRKYVGKENGRAVYDKRKHNYYVYWFDEETLKRKSTSYSRWWWEINKGEVPDGYKVSYKDGDGTNISPDNIVLFSEEEIGKLISRKLMGHEVSHKTRQKISIAHTGTDNWRGIAHNLIYLKWSKQLKEQVRERDNYTCQVCGKSPTNARTGKVHHIDGDKHNSVLENLILVCTQCHALIHCKKSVEDKILELRAKLNH